MFVKSVFIGDDMQPATAVTNEIHYCMLIKSWLDPPRVNRETPQIFTLGLQR
jgi:hypothetical protein